MKRLTIPFIIAVIFLNGLLTSVSAQLEEFGSFITTGVEDAQEMFNAYLSPYISGFGASLTGGWYNTAKTHNLGGFDITITLNAAVVPEESRIFNVDDLELNHLQRASGTSNMSPTVAGQRESGPDMEYSYAGFTAPAFSMPEGTGVHYVPSPMLQLGVGLFKGTEIIGRYMPNLSAFNAKIGFWGIGLKHDIKQWIPGLKKLPVLNISVLGGYTKLNSSVGLEVFPDDIGLGSYVDLPEATWDDQRLTLGASSFTANLIVSANLPIVCFYGGVGFANTKANLTLEGNFPMIDGIDTNLDPIVVARENPIDIQVDRKEGGLTKPRFNTGIRFKFGIFTLHFDYTRSTYNVATAGLGFTFR